MENKWKKEILSNIATFKYGKMPQKNNIIDKYKKGLYPIFSGYRTIGYYKEYNTEDNSLIVIARGVGGTGEVRFIKEKTFLTNLSISMNLNKEKVDAKFLFYFLKKNNLRYLDSGSAQSQITIRDLENVKIFLPPLNIQKKTAKLLSDIDEKIELNNKINDNLQFFLLIIILLFLRQFLHSLTLVTNNFLNYLAYYFLKHFYYIISLKNLFFFQILQEYLN